ncbi:unnamed protein product [Calypogeia fissa]
MGLSLYFPLLTLLGLKLGHYLFLVAVRGLWHLSNYINAQSRTAADRFSGGASSFFTTSQTSWSSSNMPAISAGQTAHSPRHSLAQFLNNILSMRGPANLPYEEDVKFYIRQHLLAVVKEFQGLQIKTATFTHNNGRASFLLQAAGTIPMYYKDVKYNIPITMWLVEAYPRVAPLVFVTPTRDMIIKPQHRHVDASGTVTVPYLQQWIFPRSNLLELVRNLSTVFGEEPPLYSRPAAPQREPAASTSATHSIHATNPLHSSTGPEWTSPAQQGSPNPQSPSRVNRPPPYTVDPSSPGSSSRLAAATKATTPVQAFQITATNSVTKRLQRDSKAILRRGEVEMNDLFSTQVLLNERKEQIEQGFRDMQQEKESLEEQLQFYMTNTDVIEAWLRENEGGKSNLSIDGMFQPVDDISRQLLESTAADLSIEDVLYSLDRAVQDGSIPWEAYLKAVRQLSREQFYHRATCLKVAGVQSRSSMASEQ